MFLNSLQGLATRGCCDIALPGTLSRTQVLQMIPKASTHYSMKMSKAIHSKFGGVTHLAWHMIHFSRVGTPVTATTLMTKNHFVQSLQTSLDDTEGLSFAFEPCPGKDYIGTVAITKGKETVSLKVYDADGLAPVLQVQFLLHPDSGSFGFGLLVCGQRQTRFYAQSNFMSCF